MVIHRQTRLVALVAAVALFPGLSVTALKGPSPAQEDRLTKLEGLVIRQQQRIEALEVQVHDLSRLGTALVSGAKSLGASVQSSRDAGFEWAGPNPASKTSLLEGLLQFNAHIEKAVKTDDKEQDDGKSDQ